MEDIVREASSGRLAKFHSCVVGIRGSTLLEIHQSIFSKVPRIAKGA